MQIEMDRQDVAVEVPGVALVAELVHSAQEVPRRVAALLARRKLFVPEVDGEEWVSPDGYRPEWDD